MKNTAKHSIKCNKRDKVSPLSVEYQVYYRFYSREQFIGTYPSKLLALQIIANSDCPEQYHIIKVTCEKVIS